jgi:hypothetical protein
MTGSDGPALGSDLWLADDPARHAWQAQRRYPAVLWQGPVYGLMEQVPAGWLMNTMRAWTPQEARDSLGWWLRVLARRRSTPPADREECWAVSARLEIERLNDLVVADRPYRVVRADQFSRHSSLAGPEPPRPADPPDIPDPIRAEGERPRQDIMTGGLLGPAQTPGSAALLGERWEVVPEGPMVPPEVTRDAREALRTHPKIAMFPPRFAVAENADGRWRVMIGPERSPREAREVLALRLTNPLSILPQPWEQDRAACEKAVRLLKQEQRNQLTVAGHRLRIIRIETAVRIGPDGPEPPRASDYDPDPPMTGETAELRTWDLLNE